MATGNTPPTSSATRNRQDQINRYVHTRVKYALKPVIDHLNQKVEEGFMTQQELKTAYFYCGLKED